MLKQRVLTAVVLLLILLPALFYPSPIAFCAVAVVLIAAAAWEWARLNGCSAVVSYSIGMACLALCLLFWNLGLLERPLPTVWLLS